MTRCGATEPLRSAAPHPLDLPTEEQGIALAALESRRWMVEPGTDALAARGGGPGPSDALGIVRELRVRDWLGADGEITLVGRRALSRWLGGGDSEQGTEGRAINAIALAAAGRRGAMLSDLSAAIYGLMTVGALLAAESADSETYAETVGAVAVTMIVYWLAHSYAEFASTA